MTYLVLRNPQEAPLKHGVVPKGEKKNSKTRCITSPSLIVQGNIIVLLPRNCLDVECQQLEQANS